MIDRYIEKKLKNIKTNEFGYDYRLSQLLCMELNNRFDLLGIKDDKKEGLVKYLNLLANKDINTAEHSVRVGLLGDSIARELGRDRKALFHSGLLHDIGKALVPVKILTKTSGFGEKDRKIMCKHPLLTFKILGKKYAYSALMGVRHHTHQPNGYPKELPVSVISFPDEVMKNIDEDSKILAVADFFDAAVSRKNDKFVLNGIISIDTVLNTIIELNLADREVINYLKEKGIFNEHMKLIAEPAIK